MSTTDATEYDIAVIGGGIAGLTAGLFGARYGRSTLVLESVVPGGHLNNIEKIEDFPGFPEGLAGYDLCPTVHEQAERAGAQFALAEVERVKSAAGDHPIWHVVTSQGTYTCRAVIVASGTRPAPLGVPGEIDLYGRGISHCASCDGPLYAGKVVGVVGGHDDAIQEALTLAAFAERVIVFNPSGVLPGQETYRRRAHAQPKIEVRHNMAVVEILGEASKVAAVRVRDLTSGVEAQVDLAGVFIYAGYQPNTAFMRDHLPLKADGRIPTDTWMRTAQPGLFAAGDVRHDSPRHAITSAGEGATAAVAAHRYIESLAGR
ncbi:MAG TPA: FAD-dependent oxidoreductase [Chloroflexota bacterium]|nr:FAD-dependent oxidoreductase [Chloroflexota bacterium]